MAYLDSADIVRRAKLRLNRPATDEAFTATTADDVLYDFATEEQDEITKLLAVYVPDALWTVPTALTSSDGGYTYGFGTDTDGAAIFALGRFHVYEARTHIPDTPLVVGVDFTVEGTVLRMPHQSPRTFADSGPWAQYVAPSNVITSSTQPTIPKIARLCLVARVASRGAKRLGLDPSEHDADAEASWLQVLAAIRTQAHGKGGAPYAHRPRTYDWRFRR
jgi:hypothetical protein